MPIDTTGDWWVGSDPADIQEYLAAYTLEDDGYPATAFRRLDAGNDLDEGRLARTVFPDQAVHLSGLERQIDIAKRMDAAEALRNAGHLKEGRQGVVLR